MNIVFFGSSKYVIPILEVLQKNFNLLLVLTTENPALPAGRPKAPKPNSALQGLPLQSYPVVKYCVENKIPYLSIQQFSNLTIKELKNCNASVGILADFGLIIPQKILTLFPKGIINIHPSLLPKYRGPTPVQTAILNGDKTTGVTIIKLDGRVDHGPILFQKQAEILPNDTSESLYVKLFSLGASRIVKTIELYLKGEIKPQEQDHSKATFTKPLTRQDGYIDELKIKNEKLKINRMIRAYFPWPGVFTKLKINNKELRIKFLPNKMIQVEGKKPMSYKDFINGYPDLKQIQALLAQL